MPSNYQALVNHLADVQNLNSAAWLLEWDLQVNMPPAGSESRSHQIATLSRLRHELFTSPTTAQLLEAAGEEVGESAYESDEASLLRVVQQDYHDATKLPSKFVSEWAQVTTAGHEVWAKARQDNDFKAFQPTLERIMDLARQRADYLGYTDHPYDALLNEYERGVTTLQVQSIFDGHKPQLVELISAISEQADKVNDSVLHQPFEVAQQKEFAEWAVTQIGFDFQRGRHDVAVHPFAISFSRDDVRITNRYQPDFFNTAVFGMLHEAGHGMYEQGSGVNLEMTALAGGTSLGVHESQSRLWENIVGRSRGFWTWALPKLQEVFPAQFGKVDVETFYPAINKVQRSFIRVEADEATYNLHIMLRFEIEMGLLNGEINVSDLPVIWNDRFQAYFGIVPPNDTLGVLQDVHWSAGLIGYFPTYALGNLLSVQYYNQALTDHPEIPAEIEEGKFSTLLTWLNTNIHQHGRKFTADELTRRVTGTSIDSAPYMQYLKSKYSEIYGL